MAEIDSENAEAIDISATEAQRAPEPSSAEASEGQRSAGSGASTGTSYCVRCGGSMPGGDRYCRSCGWETGVEPPAAAPASRPVIPNASESNRLAALLLCIFIGVFGGHRFYVGKIGTGVLWLFTFGLFTIGAIYDLVLIGTGEFRDSEQRKVVYWQ